MRAPVFFECIDILRVEHHRRGGGLRGGGRCVRALPPSVTDMLLPQLSPYARINAA